jgi:pimeloyl-ACP methyl ester carboxylesterase
MGEGDAMTPRAEDHGPGGAPAASPRQGGGPTRTVVFLHGVGTTSGMWAEHVKMLPEFRCLTPDLPGHGTASKRPWVSLAQTTSEIAALIEATPEKRAHVVGLSLGGAVALELLNTRPELVDRVIIDGAGAMRWRFSPLLAGAVALISPVIHSLPFMRLVAQGLSIKADRRPGFYREFRLVGGGSFRRSVRHALGVQLRNTKVPGPVLLVAAGHDVGATRVSNATLARVLPDASAWYVPGTWHAWVGANPNLHKAMVRAFLTDAPLPDGLVPETSRPRRSIAKRRPAPG